MVVGAAASSFNLAALEKNQSSIQDGFYLGYELSRALEVICDYVITYSVLVEVLVEQVRASEQAMNFRISCLVG